MKRFTKIDINRLPRIEFESGKLFLQDENFFRSLRLPEEEFNLQQIKKGQFVILSQFDSESLSELKEIESKYNEWHNDLARARDPSLYRYTKASIVEYELIEDYYFISKVDETEFYPPLVVSKSGIETFEELNQFWSDLLKTAQANALRHYQQKRGKNNSPMHNIPVEILHKIAINTIVPPRLRVQVVKDFYMNKFERFNSILESGLTDSEEDLRVIEESIDSDEIIGTESFASSSSFWSSHASCASDDESLDNEATKKSTTKLPHMAKSEVEDIKNVSRFGSILESGLTGSEEDLRIIEESIDSDEINDTESFARNRRLFWSSDASCASDDERLDNEATKKSKTKKLEHLAKSVIEDIKSISRLRL
jgi:uncharacterized protein YifN (PemK superfamily)